MFGLGLITSFIKLFILNVIMYVFRFCTNSIVLFVSYFIGKEYVCIVRLHSAIESETKLARVRPTFCAAFYYSCLKYFSSLVHVHCTNTLICSSKDVNEVIVLAHLCMDHKS